ncbi:MAG TPA: hypothetical protein VHE61_07415 [Opitutaceae bacterium]|nr:hypothetical protein [Opitutaceae bacterium]
MEKPWKVVAAFLFVFIAGAVFGGFFSIGIGAQWMSHEARVVAPVVAPATSAPVAASPAATSPMRPNAHPAAQRPILPVPRSWQAPQLLRRYAERLNLTPEQKQRINPIIQRAIEDYRRVQQNTFRETAIILHRMQQDLISELTPQQRRELARWEKRQNEIIREVERQRELRKERDAANHKNAATPPAPAVSNGPTHPAGAASESSGATPGSAPADNRTGGTEKRE